MIDPLAGPWTVSRNPKRGKRRIDRSSPGSGTLSRAVEDDHPATLTAPSPELIARADASYGVVTSTAATATAVRSTDPARSTAAAPALGLDPDDDSSRGTPTISEVAASASQPPSPARVAAAPPTAATPTAAPPTAAASQQAGALLSPAVGQPGLTPVPATEPDRAGASAPAVPDPGAPDPGVLDPGAPDPGAPDPGAPDPAAPARSARRQARQPGQVSAGLAIPLLAVLAVAATVLVIVTVRLASLGISVASGTAAADSPLAVPAPPIAAGLPRRYLPARSPVTLQLVAEFGRRFSTAVTGRYHGSPGGLYREPGTIDPASDQPGWVAYLGFNAAGHLGAPKATIARLMASLIQTSAPNTSWRTAPGARGGVARCAIAVYARTTVSICAWATGRTFGALLSPTSDTRGNELAVLMPQLRLDLQPG